MTIVGLMNLVYFNRFAAILFPQKEKEEYLKKIPAGETPLWKHWEEFVQTRKYLGKSTATIESVRDGLRVIARHAGVYTIEQANNPQKMSEKLLQMKKERSHSHSSYNTYRKNLQTYFIWLARQGYISENNVSKIEKATEKRREQLVLSQKQVEQITGFLHAHTFTCRIERSRNIFLVDLLRFTGARPSEILDLKIESIQKKNKKEWTLCIDGKKQKGRLRSYPMPRFLIDSYLHYVRQRADVRDHDWLFISRRGAKWTRSGINCFFKKISKEMGFRVNPYSFRRYVATYLDAEGVPLKGIMRHLGHTRVSTTELYIERSGRLTEESSNAMAQLNSGGASQSISSSAYESN